jgi:hypothetical protein
MKRVAREIEVINNEYEIIILDSEVSPEKCYIKCEYEGFIFEVNYGDCYPFSCPTIKVFKDNVELCTTEEEYKKGKCLCKLCMPKWWSLGLMANRFIKIIYEDMLKE